MRISDWSADVCSSDLPSLELTGGLRYTYEKKKYDTLNNQQVIGVLIDPVNRIFLDFRGAPIPFVTGTTPDLTTNEVTPHLNISYHWSPDVMTYFSYSKGYKSSGYEQRLAPGTPEDRKSTRLNTSHSCASRMPSSAGKIKA